MAWPSGAHRLQCDLHHHEVPRSQAVPVLTNDACEASLYDCALAFVADCAPVFDCAEFSSVCLVFDKESCLVNEDASVLTEEECEAKNVGEPGNFATTRWCRG